MLFKLSRFPFFWKVCQARRWRRFNSAARNSQGRWVENSIDRIQPRRNLEETLRSCPDYRSGGCGEAMNSLLDMNVRECKEMQEDSRDAQQYSDVFPSC